MKDLDGPRVSSDNEVLRMHFVPRYVCDAIAVSSGADEFGMGGIESGKLENGDDSGGLVSDCDETVHVKPCEFNGLASRHNFFDRVGV